MQGPSPEALAAEIEKRAKALAPAKRAVWGAPAAEPAPGSSVAAGGGAGSAAGGASTGAAPPGVSPAQAAQAAALAAAFTLTQAQAVWLLQKTNWNADLAAEMHLGNPGAAERAVGASAATGPPSLGRSSSADRAAGEAPIFGGAGAGAPEGSAVATGAKDADAEKAAAGDGGAAQSRVQFRMGALRCTAALGRGMTVAQLFAWVGARIDAGARFTMKVRRSAAEQELLKPSDGQTIEEAGMAPRALVLVEAEGATKFDGAKKV